MWAYITCYLQKKYSVSRDSASGYCRATSSRSGPVRLVALRSPEQSDPNEGRKDRRDEHGDLGGREDGRICKCLPCDEQRHREADATDGSCSSQLTPRVLRRLDSYSSAHDRRRC